MQARYLFAVLRIDQDELRSELLYQVAVAFYRHTSVPIVFIICRSLTAAAGKSTNTGGGRSVRFLLIGYRQTTALAALNFPSVCRWDQAVRQQDWTQSITGRVSQEAGTFFLLENVLEVSINRSVVTATRFQNFKHRWRYR